MQISRLKNKIKKANEDKKTKDQKKMKHEDLSKFGYQI